MDDRMQNGVAIVLQRALTCNVLERIYHDPELTKRHFMATVHQLHVEGYDTGEIKVCMNRAKMMMDRCPDIGAYPYPDVVQ